jgi:uncharacterized protein YlxW (UPF0749 family)
MIQLQVEESQLIAIRRELQENAERLQSRADQLPTMISRYQTLVEELQREFADVKRRLSVLIGDEANGMPGLVLVINEQLNLFGGENGPIPSHSLGRRGHPAPSRWRSR